MKYAKDISIGLTYGILFIWFLIAENANAYLFYFTLWSEMVILTLMYSITEIFNKKGPSKSNSVLLGATPLLLLSFIVLSITAGYVDGVEFNDFPEYPWLLRPFVYYKWEIICIVLGILISYGIDFFSKKNAVQRIELSLIKQGIMIWVLGMITVAILFIIPKSAHPFAISCLPLSRMILELWFVKTNRKINAALEKG